MILESVAAFGSPAAATVVAEERRYLRSVVETFGKVKALRFLPNIGSSPGDLLQTAVVFSAVVRADGGPWPELETTLAGPIKSLASGVQPSRWLAKSAKQRRFAEDEADIVDVAFLAELLVAARQINGWDAASAARVGAALLRQRLVDGLWTSQTYVNPFYAAWRCVVAGGSMPGDGVGEAICARQNSDGGWGASPEAPSDSLSTASAVLTLLVLRESQQEISHGVTTLRAMSDDRSAFPIYAARYRPEDSAYVQQSSHASATVVRALELRALVAADNVACAS